MDESKAVVPLSGMVRLWNIVILMLGVLLAFGFLVPTHTPPWRAFHTDAWVAFCLAFVAGMVMLRCGAFLMLPASTLFLGGVACIPYLQFVFGAIASSGTAWINTLYLLGFMLAFFVGFNWEKYFPGEVALFIFSVLMLAAVSSVILQIIQFFGLTDLRGMLNSATGSRYVANLGQPNNLASLILLGMLGAFFLYLNGKLAGWVCMGLIVFLTIGVTLTQSRTAWLNALLISTLIHLLWKEQRPANGGRAIFFLALFFLLAQISFPLVNSWILDGNDEIRSLTDPTRLAIWRMALSQLTVMPIWGWGWGEVTEAMLPAMAIEGRNFWGPITNVHNIVLELLLTNGVILGGVLCVLLVRYLYLLARLASIPGAFVMLLACLVLVSHSFLEYPIHRAYFLLPFGMLLGALDSRRGENYFVIRNGVALGVLILGVIALSLTVKDYFEVERTMNAIESAQGKPIAVKDKDPELLLLTQWKDRLQFANADIRNDLAEKDYERMKGIVISTPSPFLYFRLAQNLAESGRRQQAKEWLEIICTAAPPTLIQLLEVNWMEHVALHQKYAQVGWAGCQIDKGAKNSPTEN